MNYYISDLHLGHKNIIRFDGRPFGSIDEMKETITKNWNKAVTPQDTVYILGDFCWGTEKEWIEIVQKLNGHKVLIRGNHDIKHMSSLLIRLFRDITDYKEITDNKKHVIMSHYPMLLYKGAYNPNCYMLCGHIHNTRENDFLNKWRNELQRTWKKPADNMGQIYNVGCMMPYMDYTPRTLNEIVVGANKEVEKIR